MSVRKDLIVLRFFLVILVMAAISLYSGITGSSALAVQNNEISVFPGCSQLPSDPDSDGLYEDLNGNGRKDFSDVVLHFRSQEWIRQNEPITCFDYNNNGRIDFADTVLLFKSVNGVTAFPTSNPTPVPTSNPTSNPTPVPTSDPTTNPTPLPTQTTTSPTPLPTQSTTSPTPLPTQSTTSPTPLPTQSTTSPTPLPTTIPSGKPVDFDMDPGNPTSCGLTCRETIATITNTGDVTAHDVCLMLEVYNSDGELIYLNGAPSVTQCVGDIPGGQSAQTTIIIDADCGSAFEKCLGKTLTMHCYITSQERSKHFEQVI